MITYEEIKTALLSNSPTKVAVSSGSVDIPIYGASTSELDPSILVAPYSGVQFKLTEDYTLKILD